MTQNFRKGLGEKAYSIRKGQSRITGVPIPVARTRLTNQAQPKTPHGNLGSKPL